MIDFGGLVERLIKSPEEIELKKSRENSEYVLERSKADIFLKLNEDEAEIMKKMIQKQLLSGTAGQLQIINDQRRSLLDHVASEVHEEINTLLEIKKKQGKPVEPTRLELFKRAANYVSGAFISGASDQRMEKCIKEVINQR